MRRLSAMAIVVLALAAPAAAQPFAAQGAQMPDPKQMSGLPLPVPDLPVGSVSARVIRGALTNPLKGEKVELTGPGVSQSATTDDAGRANFGGLAPGTRVKAVVVVNGERVESQEFDVPAAGGIRLMLVATDPDIEKKAAEDRKLAQEPAVSGIVVLGEQSRFVVEVGDDALNVFNLLQIVNTAKRPVQTDGPLVFSLPEAAVGLGMLDGSSPSAVAAGGKVTVTGPFAPGVTPVQFAYSMSLGSDRIVIAQPMPAQMTQMSVVAQKIGAMQLASPQVTERREMSSDGETFIVGQGGAVRAGDVVTLTLTGLPSRATWPRNVALALAAGILVVGAWAAARRRAGGREPARLAKLHARRDTLFAELTALEARRRKGSVDAREYASTREQLVSALEDLYAGLDREAVA